MLERQIVQAENSIGKAAVLAQKRASALGGDATSPGWFRGTDVKRKLYLPAFLVYSLRAFKSQSSPIGIPNWLRNHGCNTGAQLASLPRVLMCSRGRFVALTQVKDSTRRPVSFQRRNRLKSMRITCDSREPMIPYPPCCVCGAMHA